MLALISVFNVAKNRESVPKGCGRPARQPAAFLLVGPNIRSTPRNVFRTALAVVTVLDLGSILYPSPIQSLKKGLADIQLSPRSAAFASSAVFGQASPQTKTSNRTEQRSTEYECLCLWSLADEEGKLMLLDSASR
jgi:hypothetical protein